MITTIKEIVQIVKNIFIPAFNFCKPVKSGGKFLEKGTTD
jgi:hypothetical protein